MWLVIETLLALCVWSHDGLHGNINLSDCEAIEGVALKVSFMYVLEWAESYSA